MVSDQFLNFLDLYEPSYNHHRGIKLLPWDRQRLMLKFMILSIRCQNFRSIGPIGQKFDVFAKMAFKSMALWHTANDPLSAGSSKQDFDTAVRIYVMIEACH